MDEDCVFLLDEEVEDVSNQIEKAHSKPIKRKPISRQFTSSSNGIFSSSCPPKPTIGSLPHPTHSRIPDLLLPPSSVSNVSEESSFASSLFTGRREYQIHPHQVCSTFNIAIYCIFIIEFMHTAVFLFLPFSYLHPTKKINLRQRYYCSGRREAVFHSTLSSYGEITCGLHVEICLQPMTISNKYKKTTKILCRNLLKTEYYNVMVV